MLRNYPKAYEADRADALRVMNVSRETTERLDIFVEILDRWSQITNLVSAKAWPSLWTRHILDCAQINEHLTPGHMWADLGGGAGFPGIVVALINSSPTNELSHIIESDQRKAAFLTEAARITEARVIIHSRRIEHVLHELPWSLGAIISRAVAPLHQLTSWSKLHIDSGATGLFLKGAKVQMEIEAIRDLERYVIDLLPSRSSTTGYLCRVRRRQHLQPVNTVTGECRP